MFCTQCGSKFSSTENFCGQCGAARLKTCSKSSLPTKVEHAEGNQEQLNKKRLRKLVAKDYQPKYTSADSKEIIVYNQADDTIYSRFFDVTTSIKGLYNWIVYKAENLPAQFELGCIEPCNHFNCRHIFPLIGAESRTMPIAGLPDTLQIVELSDDPHSSFTCYDEVYFSSMDFD